MTIDIRERKPVSAVFVDVENMAVEREVGIVDFDIGRVMARIAELTRPIVRKAYADWFRLRRFRDVFLRAGFDQVQTTYINRSKNGLDMQMCVDAMEVTLLTREVEVIFLVTADSDFAALARALRRHGRHVYAIGWSEKSNEIFRAHCDEFIPYEQLAQAAAEEPAPTVRRSGARAAAATRPTAPAAASPARKARDKGADDGRALADLDGAIAQAVVRYGAGQSISARQFSSAMRAGVPGFDPRRFGFSTMTALVHAHPLLSRDPQSPGTSLTIVLPQRIDLAALLEQAAEPAAAVQRLAEAPVGFLGREQQYAVLEALHEVYVKDEAGFRRADVVAQVAERLPDLKPEDIERIDRLVWEAHVFQVEDRSGGSDALRWTVRLSARYQDVEALRFEHDKRLIAEAMAAGIVLRARDWARVLDGDEVEVVDFADILLELGFVDPDLAEGGDADATPENADADQSDAEEQDPVLDADDGTAGDHAGDEEGDQDAGEALASEADDVAADERSDVSFGFASLFGDDGAAPAADREADRPAEAVSAAPEEEGGPGGEPEEPAADRA